MTILESIILGAVQGITEFLPVSSSGHLQIAKELLGVHIEENLTFDVALHAGTVCSTIVILWSEVKRLFLGLFSTKFNQEQSYVAKILLSAIPVVIVGFTCRDALNEMLSSKYIMLIVGAMLLITALLLSFAQYAKPKKREDIGWGDAIIMGVAQAVAVMPGISRSGATIATGILLGARKERVAEFSFLMVLIPIMGASLLDVVDIVKGEVVWQSSELMPLVVGFFAAFAVGAAACKFMIEAIRRGKLVWFAIYCLAASLLSFGLYIWN
ncbi:MAG: undecaprenyl-diphosphate phosphatase [Rikenellaceae bacterium]